MAKHTIELDHDTQKFFQGVAAASTVNDSHASLDFPDAETQTKMFWFYVGVLAVSEYDCKTQADFAPFTQGAATRQPAQEENA